MAVVKKPGNSCAKRGALLLSILLAQPSVFARSDLEQIFFQAAQVPAAEPFVLPPLTAEVRAANDFLPPASATNITTTRARIARLEANGDFYSPAIAELSEQLGRALQAQGQHGAAIEAYDRSFQIMRRQEGLFSTAQASILQAKVKSQLALGDVEAADVLQRSLLTMQQQLLAEKPLALARAHLDSADWNLKYYLQARQSPAPGGRTPQQQQALAERLGEAFMQYHQALWLLSTIADDVYEEKVAIERKIAAVTLLVDRQYQRDFPATLAKQDQHSIHQSKRAHNAVLSSHGRAALLRAIDYSVATAEPVLIAESQLELADWYLLMDQPVEARATYATAVAALRAAGVQEQQIAAILEPGLPVRDPETALLELAGQEESVTDFDGYIDVSFDLNRYGKASNTRVLAGASYDERVEEDLLRQIHDGRFRPGFDHGAPADRTEVKLRYYFAR